MAAAAEIAEGRHDDQFPIDVFQTGSGTSSNMNANEVIASICARNDVTVHPNDDVNMSQSSNDTFPTATHIAATEAAVRQLIPALEVLHASLTAKARQWRTVVKSGRTHLMDAVPVTLGQEFGGYARQIEAGIERVRAVLPRLGELAIGGTAVGTGLNAPDGFGTKVVEVLVAQTGLAELRTARNSFEAQAARDGLVEASGALKTIAVSLTKIANDMTTVSSSTGVWSSNLLAAPNVRINGRTRDVTVWSGSTGLGMAWNGGLGTSAPAGITTGLSSFKNFQWMSDTLNPKTSYFSIYGLSEELTYSTVPAPGAIALLGAAGLLGRRRRA
jgi:hypothetical protein